MANGAMWGHLFESFVFGEILKSYYNDGIVKPALFYYRVEIKNTSDPNKSMIRAFHCIDNIPAKKMGTGTIICLAKELLPMTDQVWILPAQMI